MFDPLVVDDYVQLDRVMETGRAPLHTLPAQLRSPLASPMASSSSISSAKPPRSKLSDALHQVAFSPKRPRSAQSLMSGSTDSGFTRMARGLAREIEAEQQLSDLREKLEESEEELAYLRQQVGDNSAAEREQQLMNRIDEDQAKIEQLVKLVGGSRKIEEALTRTEAQLKVQICKVSSAESRSVELMREKEEALYALEKAQRSLSEQEHRIAQLHAQERYIFIEYIK